MGIRQRCRRSCFANLVATVSARTLHSTPLRNSFDQLGTSPHHQDSKVGVLFSHESRASWTQRPGVVFQLGTVGLAVAEWLANRARVIIGAPMLSYPSAH